MERLLYRLENEKLTDGVVVVDRIGLEVRVTTIERAIADLFDRYDLAGGAEELFNSLNLVAQSSNAGGCAQRDVAVLTA